MNAKIKSIAFVGMLSLSLGGCATFQGSHTSHMKPVESSIASGDSDGAEQALSQVFSDDDHSSLHLLEKGRLMQLIGKNNISKTNYEEVIGTVATSKMEAKVRVSKMLENTSAVLTSDLEIPYEVPDYAMTFLYPYQALNYLSENNLSDALVSIRQLSNAQYWTYQQKLLAGDIEEKYQKKTSAEGIDADKLAISDSKEISGMMKATQKIDNAYENGFSYYLASILYEAYDNNYNNAYLSMKNAARLLPDNPYVQNTMAHMQKAYDGGSAFEKNSGRIVVIYEQGFVEPRHAYELSLYLGKLGLQTIAVPYYPSQYRLLPPVPIAIKNTDKEVTKAKTALAADTTLMAAKSLSEQYPAIITREVVRLVLKSAGTAVATEKAGWIGNIGGSVYSYMTAKADERSWQLLPNNVQLFAYDAVVGDYNVIMPGVNQSVEVNANKTTLIWVINVGGFNKVYHFNL